jgi:hypothetical protein
MMQRSRKKTSRAALRKTFETLRAIMRRYESKLQVVRYRAGVCGWNAGNDAHGKPICFGSVAIRKGYVSYSLMPIYLFPDLADDVSEELEARRRGHSCFHFKSIDPNQARQLAALTKAGFERYKKEGLL